MEQEMVGNSSNLSLENTGDEVIPEDISLPSQFLLPNLDDSSSDEETRITELKTEVELTGHNNGIYIYIIYSRIYTISFT